MKHLLVKITLGIVLCTSAFGMGKREKGNQLTFHIETDQTDGPKMIFPLEMGDARRFFSKSPLTFTKEIVAYTPFIGQDGAVGATFQFTPAATGRINAVSTQQQGRWLVAMLNGRFVDAVLIDRPIVDGKLVIWQGIQEPEIYAFDLVLPHIGEDRDTWKKRVNGYKAVRENDAKIAKERKRERKRRAQ